MPGCHWVWDSLRDKIFKLAALMILSKHILEGEALVFRGNTECLLTSKDNFVMADTDDQWKNQQGAYVACDPCRGVFIRSGTAEVGLVKRWREHINASKRSTPGDKNSVLYSSYCHPNTAEVNKPPFKSRKGNFLQLDQMVAVGFNRDKAKCVVSLFNWSDSENKQLNKLTIPAIRNTLENRQYKHVCYLIESVYALAIAPTENLSSNPGCEWQLKYYGEK